MYPRGSVPYVKELCLVGWSIAAIARGHVYLQENNDEGNDCERNCR